MVRLVTFKEIAEIKEEEFGARNVDVMDTHKKCAREDQGRSLKKMKMTVKPLISGEHADPRTVFFDEKSK